MDFRVIKLTLYYKPLRLLTSNFAKVRPLPFHFSYKIFLEKVIRITSDAY